MISDRYVQCPVCWRVIHSSKLTNILQKRDRETYHVGKAMQDYRFFTMRKELPGSAAWSYVTSTKVLDPKVYFTDHPPHKICNMCRKAIDNNTIVTPPKFFVMASPGPLKDLVEAVWQVERSRIMEERVNKELSIINPVKREKPSVVVRTAFKQAKLDTGSREFRRQIIGQTFRRFPEKISEKARKAFATCIIDGAVSHQQALWLVAQVNALESRIQFMYVSTLIEDMFSRLEVAEKVHYVVYDLVRDLLESLEYFGFGGVHPKRRNRELLALRKRASLVGRSIMNLWKKNMPEGDPHANAAHMIAHSLMRIFGKPNPNMVAEVCADYVECACFGLDWSPDQCFAVMHDLLCGVLSRAKTVPKPVTTFGMEEAPDKKQNSRAAETPLFPDAYALKGHKFWQSDDYNLPADRYLMQDGNHEDGVVLRVIHNSTNLRELDQTYIVSQDALDTSDGYTEISWQVIKEVKEARTTSTKSTK